MPRTDSTISGSAIVQFIGARPPPVARLGFGSNSACWCWVTICVTVGSQKRVKLDG